MPGACASQIPAQRNPPTNCRPRPRTASCCDNRCRALQPGARVSRPPKPALCPKLGLTIGPALHVELLCPCGLPVEAPCLRMSNRGLACRRSSAARSERSMTASSRIPTATARCIYSRPLCCWNWCVRSTGAKSRMAVCPVPRCVSLTLRTFAHVGLRPIVKVPALYCCLQRPGQDDETPALLAVHFSAPLQDLGRVFMAPIMEHIFSC